jgi:hypothetical protein
LTQKHTAEHCHSFETPKPRPWWKDRVLWSAGVLAVAFGLGRFWPAVSESLRHSLAKAGGPVLLGLLLGGMVDHFIPKEYIIRWLAGKHRRTILASAGLGFLASSCSHGCLALSMELYRKGASVPAVITFLLASPWASLSLTLLIVSMMGAKGLLVVVAALGIAMTSGFSFQQLESRGWVDPNPHTVALPEQFSIRQDLKRRFQNKPWTAQELSGDLRGIALGSWELAQMVVFWVALGFTFSAVLGALLPESWWGAYFGPSLPGLLATMLAATVIEVCSEGTAPLAVELFRRTGALGNAFAFLMGGVVTDFTELSLLWSNLGKKVVGWFLLVTLPQVFLVGLILNFLWR